MSFLLTTMQVAYLLAEKFNNVNWLPLLELIGKNRPHEFDNAFDSCFRAAGIHNDPNFSEAAGDFKRGFQMVWWEPWRSLTVEMQKTSGLFRVLETSDGQSIPYFDQENN